MKKFKANEKERGITLVALIITIIILVILAAVSLRTVFYDGMIDVATNGVGNYAKEQKKEEEEFEKAQSIIEEKTNRISGGGSGDDEPVTPDVSDIKIASRQDLERFRDRVNNGETFEGKTVRVVSDIELGGSSSNRWEPIGTGESSFAGVFEGDGHKIKGLYIVGTGDSQGLFASNNGIIQNIEIENGRIESTYTTTGMLVGTNNGTVENVKVSGEVIGETDTGGIVGTNREGASISKSINAANINKDRTSFSSRYRCWTE